MTPAPLTRIRRIARAGDTLRAWRMFESAGLLESDHPETLSLKGRLLKDRGLRAEGTDRNRLLEQAQDAYMRSASGRRATYPLINAATIAFLNGRPEQARLLARQILTLLESGDHEPETRYWLGATEAEAHLLLGDPQAGRAALERAIAAAPEAWEDHAATLRQFSQILKQAAQPIEILDHLRPPPSLYFSGIIGLPADEAHARRLIDEALDRIRPCAVFGALAAGADILIAELAVARGAQLNIILPTAMDAFRQLSVAQFGPQWPQRFDRLIELAEYVEAPAETLSLSDGAIIKGNEIAMGLALRHAEALATQAVALHVGRSPRTPVQPERLWRDRGLPFHALVLEDSPPSEGAPLHAAINKAILSSASPFAILPGPSVATADTSEEGFFFLTFNDLTTAMDLAVALLRAAPESRLGLEYRTVRPEEETAPDRESAMTLARAAPEGGVCAPWPQIAAMDLHAPHYRFEAAGEIMAPSGDFPIGLYYPPCPA